MDRRNAGASYYFPRQFFERLQADLQKQCAWFYACVGDRVISTELVLVSANRIYSFLGGTDASWFHVRPNDLLKVEIMNWARHHRKTEFVLGGGPSRGDGIYRYKLSFAPQGSVPFSIGTRILDPGAYTQLIQARERWAGEQGQMWTPSPDYFPAYRG
jgi:CelD/BcsL family acetyltransferase involved in cellulose biosynthesis